MKTRSILVSAAIAAAAISGGAGIGACGGGPPPDATTILKSDGFTPISLSSLGSVTSSSFPSGDVSSMAAGVSASDSSEFGIVVVLTPAGQGQVSSTDLANTENDASSVGAHMTYSGGVVTLTGTADEFRNLSS
jgi:hypothetical protein